MIATVIIAVLTCLALVVCVLVKPEVKIKKFNMPLYPLIAVLGAVCAVAFTPLTLDECWQGITGVGAVNPLKILTLFISVTAISIFLDEVGFFEFLACKVLKAAGSSKIKLFILLYVTVSVLTVFTSNDIVILTFTPFILYFCRNAKIKATPFLIAEFAAANTWSMMLMIGNPTNVYIASSAGITFTKYVSVMAVPTIFAGLATFAVLLLMFRKSLGESIEKPAEQLTVEIKDKPLCILGISVLAVCTISLVISEYIHIEMWLECAACAVFLIIATLLVCAIRRRKPVALGKSLARVPYSLIPFVLGMFIVVLALNNCGATAFIADVLDYSPLVEYGIGSFLASNMVNNIPMSVLFSSVIQAGDASNAAIYASIVGSNLGALLTPVGALAGIMFSSITKRAGEKFSNLTFMKYGICVSAAGLAASLAGLLIFV
ncbi:MAG: SLC13 family permease [Candidatus Coproplasma sp.]